MARISIPGPTPMANKTDDDYQAESDYRSLCCAAEIVEDKARMKKAMAYGEKHIIATETFFGQVAKITGVGKPKY